MGSTTQEATNIINEVEDNRDLFNTRNNGPLWDYVRIALWEKIREVKESKNNPDSTGEYKTDFSNIIKNTIFGCIKNNPIKSSSQNIDILFHGFSRRVDRGDGFKWCVHCDPLIESIDHSWVFIENPNLHMRYQSSGRLHDTPAKTPQVDYTDFFTLVVPAVEKMGLGNQIQNYFGENLSQQYYDAADQIADDLGVEIDTENLIRLCSLRRNIEKYFYKKILDRSDPEIVIAVNRGQKLALIESCNDLSIPTVLLQQGAIYDSHISFSYDLETNIATFPDYLFTFGEFWEKMIDIPIEDKNIRTVGWPYLEKQVERYDHISTENTILILSQPHIGKLMSDFAVELARKLDNYNVIFKPHPNVGQLARKKYPELEDSPASIIHDQSLHQLFAKSEIQVGYSSTAIFEGIRFGLKTYIVEGSNTGHIDRLLETDSIIGVKDPNQVHQHLSNLNEIHSSSTPTEQFFYKNPMSNIDRELKQIMSS